MYNYVPIKNLTIKNFRNIGKVELDFTESPIISLIGDNEAGKTSCIKAFAVCALHAWPRDQKDFIREGTNGFGVGIELEDGTMIARLKTKDVNRYWIKMPDGTEWDTNKIDAGLPVQVQSVMGLIEEPETKEFLQVRTYEDQLLLVVTPASTNYKVMYNALKVDQLTRAIKSGSLESNALRASIDTNEISVKALHDNLRGLKIINIEPVVNIKNRLQTQMGLLSKIERACTIHNEIETADKQMGALNLLFTSGISEIDIMNATQLNSIYRLIIEKSRIDKELSNLNEIDTLESVDITHFNKFREVLIRIDELNKKESEQAILEQTNGLEYISEYDLMHFSQGIEALNRLDSLNRLYNISEPIGCETVDDLEISAVSKASHAIAIMKRDADLFDVGVQIDAYIIQVENYIKSLGAAVVTCNKCGEDIVVDTESI